MPNGAPVSSTTTGRHPINPRAGIRRTIDRVLGGELGGTIAVAVVWGAVVAAAIWAALLGLHELAAALWGGSGPAATGGIAGGAWWLVLLLPTAGGLVCGLVGRLLAPRAGGGLDVADLIDSIGRRGGRVDLYRSLARTFGSIVAVGAGGSAGPEGPLVHLGGGTLSTGGRLLGFDGQRLKVLVACGAAAGLAAVFGTPFAALLLAIEVVLGAVHMRTMLPVAAAAVAAAAVRETLLATLGPAIPVLALPTSVGAVGGPELAACAIVGVGAGVLGAAFSRTVNLTGELFAALPLPGWAAPAAGGLLVGCLGVAWPEALGHGYDGPAALAGAAPAAIGAVFVLGVWKFIATALTVGSGGAGGVLVPCLFIGGALGAVAGAGLEQAGWASAGATVGTLTLVGAAALFAAASHAGLTALVLVLELTMQPFVIVPVFIAIAPAIVISSLLSKDSIHTLAIRRHGGRDPRTSGEGSVLQETPVSALVRTDAERVKRGEPLSRLVKRLVEGGAMFQHVVDENGKLLGTVSLQEVGPLLREDGVEGLLLAYDVMRAPPLSVTRSDTLATALERFARSDWEELAVVDGAGVLEGRLSRKDVLAFYAREVLDDKNLGMKFIRRTDRSAAPTDDGRGGGEPSSEVVTDFVEVPPDQAIEAMAVPPGFIGHTLQDLNLRARFGVGVISMRRRSPGGGRISLVAPDPTLPLRDGDVLVLAGPKEQMEKLSKLVG